MVSAHPVGQCVLVPGGRVDCWGYDDQYQRLGDGSGKSQLPPGVAVFDGATDLIGSTHGDFECARRADGTLYCWGYAPDCDPSYPDAGYPITPVARSDLAPLTGIALGQQFLCGVKNMTVFCCGWQNSGVLGNGVESLDYHPALQGVALPPGSNPVHAFAGGVHACALLDDGTAWCWGWNSDGQVGDGTSGANRSTPVKVVGLTGAVQLALGVDHSCARLTDGTARCWGANTHGQLGDGTTTQHLTPTVVVSPSGDGELSDVVDLHAGYDFSCALVGSGDVYCWGWNDLGQLGDGTQVDRHVATKVIALP
jgi:alpha-tubulin suppressor-like RCC1 family protein